MTLHRVKRGIEIECDNCRGVLATDTSEFAEAVQKLREEGWTAFPIDDVWKHRCSECRFGRNNT